MNTWISWARNGYARIIAEVKARYTFCMKWISYNRDFPNKLKKNKIYVILACILLSIQYIVPQSMISINTLYNMETFSWLRVPNPQSSICRTSTYSFPCSIIAQKHYLPLKIFSNKLQVFPVVLLQNVKQKKSGAKNNIPHKNLLTCKEKAYITYR